MAIRKLESYFIILVIISFVIFQRGFGTGASSGQEIFSFLLLIFVEVITLFLILRYAKGIKPFCRSMFLVFSLAFFFALSSAWSQFPLLTLSKSIHLVFTIFLGIFIVYRFSIKEFLRILVQSFIVISIISFVVILLKPNQGIHIGDLHTGSWRGLYYHKNALGRETLLFGISILIALQTKTIRRKIALPLLILAFIFLVKAQAVTSQIAFLFTFLLYPFLRLLRFQLSIQILTIIMLILVLLAGALFCYFHYTDILRFFGKDTTLQNRVFIWAFIINEFRDRPVVGYGFYSFWEDEARVTRALNWASPHAHNNWLEVLLDGGIIAASMLGFLVIVTFIKSLSQVLRRYRYSLLFLLYIIIINVLTFTDIAFYSPHNLLLLLIIVTIGYLNKNQMNVKRSKILAGS